MVKCQMKQNGILYVNALQLNWSIVFGFRIYIYPKWLNLIEREMNSKCSLFTVENFVTIISICVN